VSVEADTTWRENRPSSRWRPGLDLRDLWERRELALVLAARDFKLRYKQMVFGIGWAVLQPLSGMLLFSVLLGHFAGLPSDGLPYPVFVFAGLAVWTYLFNSVEAAAESLVEHRSLVTKVHVPRLLAPLAAVLPGLADLAISLVIVAIVMAVYAVGPGLAIVFLPISLLLICALALGAGIWLSALNVFYRDVRYALGFVLQLWFFASPVVYPTSIVDGAWRYVYALNPAVGAFDLFRWSLVEAPSPGPHDLVSLGTGLLVLGSGVLYFRSVERHLADVI
jgi:lipopolysaccharide transport system permease protein